MYSVEQMAEFVVLWDPEQQIQLVDRPDEIIWRWTANGCYTSKSAYLAQLKGAYCTFDAQLKETYCTFDAKAVWSAHAEGKYRFFGWLLMQSKILTADKSMARH
jgi:hypothetical protein